MPVLPQVLAAFLKAIGCIIPLMDATYAEYYTKEVMLVLVREFQTPDEEMKKIVLKVRNIRTGLFTNPEKAVLSLWPYQGWRCTLHSALASCRVTLATSLAWA